MAVYARATVSSTSTPTSTSTPAPVVHYSPKTSSFLFGAILVAVAVLFAILGCFMAPRRLRRRRGMTQPTEASIIDDIAPAQEKKRPVFADVLATPASAPDWSWLKPLSARYMSHRSWGRRETSDGTRGRLAGARIRPTFHSRLFRRHNEVKSRHIEMEEVVVVDGVEVTVLIEMPSMQYSGSSGKQDGILQRDVAIGQSQIPITAKNEICLLNTFLDSAALERSQCYGHVVQKTLAGTLSLISSSKAEEDVTAEFSARFRHMAVVSASNPQIDGNK
ncbi:hypothetical protein OE88DRAFT_1646609 [Heliocybe sulcata]|uniref:Uncharacterized protein n=1 Tax=Heliocybe sulcata TaxID=5364 RepID=A0A5C3MVX3_9AGAM|nr:hypothetical protein OE88DRAFT_1646609 [Heliocybe sulcata]